MGRVGITQLDVSTAAEQLSEEGTIPTVDRVREKLGTGSKSTISKYLKAWKERQPGTTASKLPGAVLKALESAYDMLNADSKKELLEKEAEHSTILKKLRVELSLAHQRLQDETQSRKNIEHERTALEKKYAELSDSKIELDNKYSVLKAESEGTAQRLADCVDQVDDLRKQIDQLHQQREHFEETLINKHQEDMAKINANLVHERTEKENLVQENSALQIQTKTVEEQLRASEVQVDVLRDERDTFSKQSINLDKQLTLAQERISTISSSEKGLKNEIESLNEELKAQHSECVGLRVIKEELLSQVGSFKDNVIQLGDELQKERTDNGVLKSTIKHLEDIISTDSDSDSKEEYKE